MDLKTSLIIQDLMCEFITLLFPYFFNNQFTLVFDIFFILNEKGVFCASKTGRAIPFLNTINVFEAFEAFDASFVTFWLRIFHRLISISVWKVKRKLI